MATTFKSKDDIKAEVPLVDYALLNGYSINKEKTSQNWVLLKNESTGDRVMIKTKENLYYNLDYDQDRGDVLQFVGNRLNGGLNVDKSNQAFHGALVKLNNFLGNYLNQDKKSVILDKEKYFRKKETLSSLQNQEWNHKPIEDYKFFTNERGIDINILKLPYFEDRLFNTYFSLPNGHILTNYAFGKYTDDKLVGLEVRNTKQKQIIGDHDGVFITNTKGMKNIQAVFYTESGIDLASYVELVYSNPKFDRSKDYCFISFSGNLYQSKMDNIIKELDKLPLAKDCKFISLTDNDLDKAENKKPGKNYDVLFTAALIDKHITPLTFSANDTYFNFDFSKKEDLNLPAIKSIFETQALKIDETYSADQRFGKYVILKESENGVNIKIPKSIDLKQTNFLEFLQELKAERLLIQHKPDPKIDWNEKKLELTINSKDYVTRFSSDPKEELKAIIKKDDYKPKYSNDWNEELQNKKEIIKLQFELKKKMQDKPLEKIRSHGRKI